MLTDRSFYLFVVGKAVIKKLIIITYCVVLSTVCVESLDNLNTCGFCFCFLTLFMCLLVVLGLHCCASFSLVGVSRGSSPAAGRRLLLVVSRVECRL